MDYKIADLDNKDFESIKKAEDLVKKQTGKDFVMIAWEKEK
ncbi:MAG: hypothetical protein Q4F66_04585 [Clostridium sp.]|nr:hypothetical protein [Clostridium sp.]